MKTLESFLNGLKKSNKKFGCDFPQNRKNREVLSIFIIYVIRNTHSTVMDKNNKQNNKPPKNYSLIKEIREDKLYKANVQRRNNSARKYIELNCTEGINKPKNMLPGQLIMFNYFEPKTKEDLEYYDAMPCTIFFGVHKTKDGDRVIGFNIHYYPPRIRYRLMDRVFTIFESSYTNRWSKPLNKEIPVGKRQIFVGGVTIRKNLLYAIIVRRSFQFQSRKFLLAHSPNFHWSGNNRESEQFAICAPSTEFLEKVPLEPGSQSVCLTPEQIRQQLVATVVKHIFQISSVSIHQEEIGIIYALIIPCPICLEGIIRRRSDAHGHPTQDIRS